MDPSTHGNAVSASTISTTIISAFEIGQDDEELPTRSNKDTTSNDNARASRVYSLVQREEGFEDEHDLPVGRGGAARSTTTTITTTTRRDPDRGILSDSLWTMFMVLAIALMVIPIAYFGFFSGDHHPSNHHGAGEQDYTSYEDVIPTGSFAAIQRSEIALHNDTSDCWTIFYEGVYDMTDYALGHPGGSRWIYGVCGINGTNDFTQHHRVRMLHTAQTYYLGPLDLS